MRAWKLNNPDRPGQEPAAPEFPHLINRFMISRLVLAASCAFAAAVACADDVRAPQVTAVFPTAEELPANHLKFYIHFSQPMKQGVFLRHCSLRDRDDGTDVTEPFRETELWSEDRMRLTLWLHPGRQKTGVNLNEDFGPVLREGRRYVLVISGKWPSENGVPLGDDVTKCFRATARATAQLDTAAWKIERPNAGSSGPLRVGFPAPLDHALLLRCLRVLGPDGSPVAGTISTGPSERTWAFTPARPWRGTAHTLAVDSILEDLAGNSLARPFERDLIAPAPAKRPATISVPFRPADAPR